MDYIVDAVEMQRADENTICYFGVPQLVLMERAALMAKEILLHKWPEIFQADPRILIAAGNGNNGGDGAALARLFFLKGYSVTVLVSGKKEKYSSALKTQMDILERYAKEDRKSRKSTSAGQSLCIVTDMEWKQRQGEGAEDFDLVVDALFGIGLSRQVTGVYQEKIEWLNRLPGKKAALDIPSGVSAQDGKILGCAFRAELTVTFGFLKRGMLFYPGREFCGERKVVDIGITEESFLGEYPAGVTLDRKKRNKLKMFSCRRPDSHKGSYGKVLLMAGSTGAPGAALLAGEAVLRSGAGMLQIVSAAENREAIVTKLPEAMYRVLQENTEWEKLLKWCDAVVIGPGIGQERVSEINMERILTLVSENKLYKPVVIDADGLNLIAASGKLFHLIKEYTANNGIVIMTPHMAEFARLLHCSIQELQTARMEKTEDYCRETGVILAAKDAVTVVGHIKKCGNFHYYVNQTGNSGMATAGSGDVLSGITGALAALAAVNGQEIREEAARKDAYFQAVYEAVYLHGLLGDRAVAKYGEVSMKAGDMIEMLPKVLSENGEDHLKQPIS